MAETVYLGVKKPTGIGQDHANIAQLALRLGADFSEELDTLTERCRALLARPTIRNAVKELATALLERKTLTGAEAKAIYDRVARKRR
jgi:hypothetical protein